MTLLSDKRIGSFKRSVPLVNGATFYQTGFTGRKVVAKVVSLCRDAQGIDHVTFDIWVPRHGEQGISERRTLNASSFREQFRPDLQLAAQ